jgi:hypothetical protein
MDNVAEPLDPSRRLADLHALQESTVWDADEKKLGKVAQVYQDSAGHPGWIVLQQGPLSLHQKIVPLDGAWSGEGEYVNDLHLAYPEKLIKHAPNSKGHEALTEEELRALHAHYGN